MKRFTAVVAFFVVPLFFFGCATPQVKYHAEDDINQNYIPFALLASRVTIAMPDQVTDSVRDDKKSDKAIAALGVDMTNKSIKLDDFKNKARIIVTPTQAQKTLRYLEPMDNGFSKTNISITYLESMKVPKTVGVVVEDNTLKVISALGAVAVAIGPLLAGAPSAGTEKVGEVTLPIVLDFSDPQDFSTFYNDKERKEVCKPIGKPNESYGYCFALTEREGRKTTNERRERYTYLTFFAAYDKTFTSHIPFSGCVDLTVTIKKWDTGGKGTTGDPLATYNTVIADPYYVDWLPLPQKGTITSQSACGANSTSEKSGNPDAFDAIEAVGKQVDAVWKAWHPAKSK